MKVNFYLKNSKADYETSVFITVVYNSKRIRVFTSEKIEPEYWNGAKQRARQTVKFPTNPEFNTRLDKIDALVKDTYRKWKNDNGEQNEPPTNVLSNLIKDALGKNPEKDNELLRLKTFWGFFDDFIARSENGVRTHKGGILKKSTIVNYKNLYNTLQRYEAAIKKKLDFSVFTIHFYNQYYSYLTGLNFSTNSIAKQISNIKLLLREAAEDGYSTNTIFTHSKFKATRDEPETVYLTLAEIDEIQNLDLSQNLRIDKVRDAFIIGCYTGLRFSDISRLSMDNVEDGILTIVQTKTGNSVSIPLRVPVLEIMAKYNNQFPRVMSNQKYNEYLREVCQLCPLLQKEVSIKEIKGGKENIVTKPKYEFISSHTARRSFATNEFLAKDIKVFQIMAITGHKTEKTFYRYIRLTKEENAKDIANIWEQRTLNEKRKAFARKTNLKVV